MSNGSDYTDSTSAGPSPVVIPAQETPPPAPAGGGCMKAVAIGCVAMVVLGIIALILMFVFAKQIGDWAVDVGFDAVESFVEESDLPQQDKERILEFTRDLQGRYDAGEIELEVLMAAVGEGAQYMMPGILHLVIVESIKESSLSGEEKAQAQLAAERVARGGFDGVIPLSDITEVFQAFEGEDKLSDEDLRTVTETLTNLADEYDIANEGYEVDYGAEIIRALEQALESARAQSGK